MSIVSPLRTSILFLLVVFALPASAQRASTTTTSTDPLADITRMFEAREPATTAAGALRRTHSRQPTEAASIMRRAGYPVTAIAGALRTEYSATLTVVYNSLKDASVPIAEIGDAFTSNSFTLDCIDPQGNPVPCGSFGGAEDAPVMGQISWTPQSQGYTDSLLTITGSSLPPMEVRIGGYVLQQVSAASSQLVARLPAMAVNSSLELRRLSDGKKANLGPYSVVSAPVPWESWAAAAIEGAAAGAKAWLNGAAIKASHCTVTGPLAVGTPGVLSSTHEIGGGIRTRLMAAGAPSTLASAWDDAFTAAWKGWADAVIIPSLPLFPAFGAIAADSAPPTPAPPVALGTFVSTMSSKLSAPSLSDAVLEAIGPHSTSSSERSAAVSAFATNIGARFTKLLLAMVTGVTGTGPVPGYAPPATPAAMVVGGTCFGTGVLSVAASTF